MEQVTERLRELSGMVDPWVAGWMVKMNRSAQTAFVLAGAVALAGALAWEFFGPALSLCSGSRLRAWLL